MNNESEIKIEYAGVEEVLNRLYFSRKPMSTYEEMETDLGFVFQDEYHRGFEIVRSRLKEGFLRSFLEYTIPEFDFELSSVQEDYDNSVDILVLQNDELVFGLDLKPAGFYESLDEAARNKHSRRVERQSNYPVPIVNLAFDLNPYGFNRVMPQQGIGYSPAINRILEEKGVEGFIHNIIDNGLLRMDLFRDNIKQFSDNYVAILDLVDHNDPNVSMLGVYMADRLIPERAERFVREVQVHAVAG